MKKSILDTGYVYLICDPANNYYKIGVTRNLNNNRIKKLQTGNPTELHIVSIYETKYPFRIETMLHNKFKCNKILNEWFELDLYTTTHFIDICKQQDNIISELSSNEFFMKNIK